MVMIQRTLHQGVLLSFSGYIEAADVVEIQRLVDQETPGESLRFDLQDITLVDREAVTFLACCEADGVGLTNCPLYLRQWIDTERRQS
ncbi:MAG: hypothetical protein J0H49_04100 [Acidobacteria bacterium]|nr:hypothetical protein [Acidobacteriota bacterium]